MKNIIDKEFVAKKDSLPYHKQRTMIDFIFQLEYTPANIMLRLVVIDSLYSTNAAYSYFSFDKMTDKILSLGTEKEAADYFYSIVQKKKDNKNLFDARYGIRKNLQESSQLMSLMTKYAYYALRKDTKSYPLGFPIYDRLAKEAYSVVCKILKITPPKELPAQKTPDIKSYIDCMQQLREEIFGTDETLFNGYQQFDILDAFLWRMGKFEEGNLSLLLNIDDYKTFIKEIKLEKKDKKEKEEEKQENFLRFKGTDAIRYKKKNGNEEPKFDFDKAVMVQCEREKSPFKGTSNEEYLNILLEYWKFFHKNKKDLNNVKNNKTTKNKK